MLELIRNQFEYFKQTIDLILRYSGTQSDMTVIFVLLATAAMIGIAYFVFGSTFMAMAAMAPTTFIGAYLGIIPWWIAWTYCIPAMFFFMANIIGDVMGAGEEEAVSEQVSGQDRWEAYGQRLKNAYEAKYGYKNPAFDEEVDSHIRQMQHLGKGFTRSIAKGWLKRMRRMTEAK